MTFTVQIHNPPFKPLQSFTAYACGAEKITLHEASARAPTKTKEAANK